MNKSIVCSFSTLRTGRNLISQDLDVSCEINLIGDCFTKMNKILICTENTKCPARSLFQF